MAPINRSSTPINFGVRLKELYARSRLKVPVLFTNILNWLTSYGLSTPDIFCASSHAEDVNALVKAYESQVSKPLESVQQPWIVGSLLKRWLESLPDPLIADETQVLLIQASISVSSQSKKQRVVQKVLIQEVDPLSLLVLRQVLLLLHHYCRGPASAAANGARGGHQLAKAAIFFGAILFPALIPEPDMFDEAKALVVFMVCHAPALFSGQAWDGRPQPLESPDQLQPNLQNTSVTLRRGAPLSEGSNIRSDSAKQTSSLLSHTRNTAAASEAESRPVGATRRKSQGPNYENADGGHASQHPRMQQTVGRGTPSPSSQLSAAHPETNVSYDSPPQSAAHSAVQPAATARSTVRGGGGAAAQIDEGESTASLHVPSFHSALLKKRGNETSSSDGISGNKHKQEWQQMEGHAMSYAGPQNSKHAEQGQASSSSSTSPSTGAYGEADSAGQAATSDESVRHVSQDREAASGNAQQASTLTSLTAAQKRQAALNKLQQRISQRLSHKIAPSLVSNKGSAAVSSGARSGGVSSRSTSPSALTSSAYGPILRSSSPTSSSRGRAAPWTSAPSIGTIRGLCGPTNQAQSNAQEVFSKPSQSSASSAKPVSAARVSGAATPTVSGRHLSLSYSAPPSASLPGLVSPAASSVSSTGVSSAQSQRRLTATGGQTEAVAVAAPSAEQPPILPWFMTRGVAEETESGGGSIDKLRNGNTGSLPHSHGKDEDWREAESKRLSYEETPGSDSVSSATTTTLNQPARSDPYDMARRSAEVSSQHTPAGSYSGSGHVGSASDDGRISDYDDEVSSRPSTDSLFSRQEGAGSRGGLESCGSLLSDESSTNLLEKFYGPAAAAPVLQPTKTRVQHYPDSRPLSQSHEATVSSPSSLSPYGLSTDSAHGIGETTEPSFHRFHPEESHVRAGGSSLLPPGRAGVGSKASGGKAANGGKGNEGRRSRRIVPPKSPLQDSSRAAALALLDKTMYDVTHYALSVYSSTAAYSADGKRGDSGASTPTRTPLSSPPRPQWPSPSKNRRTAQRAPHDDFGNPGDGSNNSHVDGYKSVGLESGVRHEYSSPLLSPNSRTRTRTGQWAGPSHVPSVAPPAATSYAAEFPPSLYEAAARGALTFRVVFEALVASTVSTSLFVEPLAPAPCSALPRYMDATDQEPQDAVLSPLSPLSPSSHPTSSSSSAPPRDPRRLSPVFAPTTPSSAFSSETIPIRPSHQVLEAGQSSCSSSARAGDERDLLRTVVQDPSNCYGTSGMCSGAQPAASIDSDVSHDVVAHVRPCDSQQAQGTKALMDIHGGAEERAEFLSMNVRKKAAPFPGRREHRYNEDRDSDGAAEDSGDDQAVDRDNQNATGGLEQSSSEGAKGQGSKAGEEEDNDDEEEEESWLLRQLRNEIAVIEDLYISSSNTSGRTRSRASGTAFGSRRRDVLPLDPPQKSGSAARSESTRALSASERATEFSAVEPQGSSTVSTADAGSGSGSGAAPSSRKDPPPTVPQSNHSTAKTGMRGGSLLARAGDAVDVGRGVDKYAIINTHITESSADQPASGDFQFQSRSSSVQSHSQPPVQRSSAPLSDTPREHNRGSATRADNGTHAYPSRAERALPLEPRSTNEVYKQGPAASPVLSERGPVRHTYSNNSSDFENSTLKAEDSDIQPPVQRAIPAAVLAQSLATATPSTRGNDASSGPYMPRPFSPLYISASTTHERQHPPGGSQNYEPLNRASDQIQRPRTSVSSQLPSRSTPEHDWDGARQTNHPQMAAGNYSYSNLGQMSHQPLSSPQERWNRASGEDSASRRRSTGNIGYHPVELYVDQEFDRPSSAGHVSHDIDHRARGFETVTTFPGRRVGADAGVGSWPSASQPDAQYGVSSSGTKQSRTFAQSQSLSTSGEYDRAVAGALLAIVDEFGDLNPWSEAGYEVRAPVLRPVSQGVPVSHASSYVVSSGSSDVPRRNPQGGALLSQSQSQSQGQRWTDQMQVHPPRPPMDDDDVTFPAAHAMARSLQTRTQMNSAVGAQTSPSAHHGPPTGQLGNGAAPSYCSSPGPGGDGGRGRSSGGLEASLFELAELAADVSSLSSSIADSTSGSRPRAASSPVLASYSPSELHPRSQSYTHPQPHAQPRAQPHAQPHAQQQSSYASSSSSSNYGPNNLTPSTMPTYPSAATQAASHVPPYDSLHLYPPSRHSTRSDGRSPPVSGSNLTFAPHRNPGGAVHAGRQVDDAASAGSSRSFAGRSGGAEQLLAFPEDDILDRKRTDARLLSTVPSVMDSVVISDITSSFLAFIKDGSLERSDSDSDLPRTAGSQAPFKRPSNGLPARPDFQSIIGNMERRPAPRLADPPRRNLKGYQEQDPTGFETEAVEACGLPPSFAPPHGAARPESGHHAGSSAERENSKSKDPSKNAVSPSFAANELFLGFVGGVAVLMELPGSNGPAAIRLRQENGKGPGALPGGSKFTSEANRGDLPPLDSLDFEAGSESGASKWGLAGLGLGQALKEKEDLKRQLRTVNDAYEAASGVPMPTEQKEVLRPQYVRYHRLKAYVAALAAARRGALQAELLARGVRP